MSSTAPETQTGRADHARRPTLPERERRPLSWRAELGRQVRRRRTMWSFVLILALPVILVAAFAIGGGGPSGNTVAGLAKVGAANFAIFATTASASFLLVVLTALFVGDAVPSEASWSTLRYLLVAPVPRARLLTSKLVVAFASAAVAVVVLCLWSLLVGGLAYGWAPFTNPAGGVLEWSEFLPRFAVIIGYLVVFLLQVGGIAFWLSTRTDAPLAAVGGAVMVTIVSSILSQIETLGGWRNGLPMYYARSWYDTLAPQVDWSGMRHGVLWSVLYTVVLVGIGYRHFQHKDILS